MCAPRAARGALKRPHALLARRSLATDEHSFLYSARAPLKRTVFTPLSCARRPAEGFARIQTGAGVAEANCWRGALVLVITSVRYYSAAVCWAVFSSRAAVCNISNFLSWLPHHYCWADMYIKRGTVCCVEEEDFTVSTRGSLRSTRAR